MWRVKNVGIYGLLVLVLACHTATEQPAPEPTPEGPPERYLFVAHTYLENPERQEVDPRVVSKDLSAYELLLLGGDLSARSTEDTTNLLYLDSVFGIRKPNVHWAIGNHDLSLIHI